MEVQIYFDIITHDGETIEVNVWATLSGSYIPADFNHDVEDNREIDVTEVILVNEDYDEIESEKLTEIVYEHVDDNDRKIYEKAEKGVSEIYLDDFKSDKNYTDII